MGKFLHSAAKKFLAFIFITVLAISAFANGSQNLYRGGVAGKRAFLQSETTVPISVLFSAKEIINVSTKLTEFPFSGSKASDLGCGTISNSTSIFENNATEDGLFLSQIHVEF